MTGSLECFWNPVTLENASPPMSGTLLISNEGEVGGRSEGPLAVLNLPKLSWHVASVSAADLKYCNPRKNSKRRHEEVFSNSQTLTCFFQELPKRKPDVSSDEPCRELEHGREQKKQNMGISQYYFGQGTDIIPGIDF